MTIAILNRYLSDPNNADKVLMWSLISGATILMMLGVYGLFTHRLIGVFILAADTWFSVRIVKLVRKNRG